MAREWPERSVIGANAPLTEAGASGAFGRLLSPLWGWQDRAERRWCSEGINEHLMRDIAFTRADVDLLARNRT
jgi:uncharacterized protein YjiS (DUF1127 family)